MPAVPGGPRCYWGLAWSWRGCRTGGARRSGLGANARATPPAPPAPGESGPQGQPLQVSPAGEIFLRLEGPARCGRPQGARPAGMGPSGGFFLWAIQRSGREEEKVAGTEGSNTSGLLECWRTWGWGVGGAGTEHRSPPLPTPGQRQGGSFAYETEVLVPSSGQAHFKALSHRNSSQRLGAITLLPRGAFMLPEPRGSQNWVDIGFNLPHPSQSYKWGGGRCPQPRELGGDAL